MVGIFRSVLLFLVMGFLSGCGPRTGFAPVEELKWTPFKANAAYYQVHSQDTLYSIAFRYERDYRALADLNHLSPPYTINPGQRLRLIGANAKPKSKLVAKKKHKVLASHGTHNLTWNWPLQGNLLKTFSPQNGRKGIDIEVKRQCPVRAAAAGFVAYAGDGIPGYGHLIIIKHSAHYLTAYAYNAKNMVKEGDTIKSGQKIAYTGRINSKILGLHFELRKEGKPVNPLKYLDKG